MHVFHEEIHYGESEEEEIDSKESWHMEGEIPIVGKRDGELLSLLEIWDVAQYNYGLADYAERVQWNPHCVSQPSQDIYLFLV